jgi:hypothetical protein
MSPRKAYEPHSIRQSESRSQRISQFRKEHPCDNGALAWSRPKGQSRNSGENENPTFKVVQSR